MCLSPCFAGAVRSPLPHEWGVGGEDDAGHPSPPCFAGELQSLPNLNSL